MWIKAERWNQLLADEGARIRQVDELHSKHVEVERANSFLQTSLEWMQTRLNQVEMLNAQLMQKEAGIVPIVPVIASKPNRSMDDILGDVGDLFRDPDEGGTE